ncbi:Iron sulfur cluster assembly protein 1 [Phytophthora nicotianae]|uniref:Iron sulfur cluster assembly protein 1 n=1 Tax=Phytophthora nicotianae TaxID=4792 RepID=A0A0W8DQ01_PHYNI|nr:Iron sulfur cluster assembly protein 1 [Phytophthora nicotianae]
MKDVTKADLRKRNPRTAGTWRTTKSTASTRQHFAQSFVNFDPHLVVGTVFFLASKVEETGVDEDESMYTFQDKDILECEFYVIEALQFDLILHHPFPSLLQYGYINLFLDEFEIHEECLQLAWQLVQYSYRTDIILLYPPFMVAYAAAYISCRDAGYDAAQVFASVNIKKDLLLKIVGEFQEAVEDEKRLYAVQATALEKLEEIIPDASAAEAEAAPSAPAEK